MKPVSVRLLAALACCLLCVSLAAASGQGGPHPGRVVISLDGKWQIAQGSLETQPATFDHTVPVPGLADLAEPGFTQIGIQSAQRQAFWYRRTFAVGGPQRAVARLKVNKAQFGIKVWLNGTLIGEHLGCCTPAWFDVTGALRYGAENVLVIRVGADRSALPPTVPTNTDYEESRWIPGIYDSISLFLTDTPYIASVQVAPHIATSDITVQAVVRQAGDATLRVPITLSVREWRSGAPVGNPMTRRLSVQPGESGALTVSVPVPHAHLWSPEDPFLYVVRCDTGADAVEARFGMREFGYDTKTGRAMLNGRPYYLRGTDFCMFRFFEDPIRGGLPWDHTWVRKLLELPKGTLHWNSARVCIAPFPEFWYDIADETGWLLQDEFPIWGFNDAWSQDELVSEFRDWLGERWNHPSIVVWDACNETLTPRTGQAISAVRDMDLSQRPWDDGYSKPNRPGDAVEDHPYQTLGQASPWDPSCLGSALDHQPALRPKPVVINEYDTFWLQRNGDLTGGYASFFNTMQGPKATPEARRELLAYSGAAESEYWRARRDAAAVQWFCYLTYSRPGAVTSDNFLDLRALKLEPHFVDYVSNAFAPLAVMIDDAPAQLAIGARREFQMIVTNDLYEPQKGTLALRLIDLSSGKEVGRTTVPFAVDALGQAVCRATLTMPGGSGSFMLSAELAPQHGSPVKSRRKLRLITAEEARKDTNLALGQPTTASSEITDERGNCPARFATDGKRGTRWSSEFADPQWLAVDLGSPQKVSRVILRWESAFGKEYRIETSMDGETWTTAYATDKGAGSVEEIRFAPVTARYVRFYGTKRAQTWGYSLWEFEVYSE
jgi:hypothetical protein